MAFPISKTKIESPSSCSEQANAIAASDSKPKPFLDLPELGDIAVKATLVRNGTNGRIYRLEKADGTYTLLKDVRPDHEWELRRDYEMQVKVYPDVTLHEIGGRHFMEMPFVPLEKDSPDRLAFSLYELLHQKPADWLSSNPKTRNIKGIAKIVRLVLAEMNRIHALGIVHGDVKTANIIIYHDNDGQIKVRFIDFSFATMKGELLPQSEHYAYGTPEFGGREMWKHETATFERDVRGLQRIFAELYLNDFFKEIEVWGVLRGKGKTAFYEPGTTFDDMPEDQIKPNVGMVLGSVVPRTTDELIEMLAEAEKDDFIKVFAKRWETAYAVAVSDPGRQSEMMYEIVKAKKLGPTVYRAIENREYKDDIVREAKHRRTATKKAEGEPEYFNYSWHSKMDYVIEKFLEDVAK